MTVLDFVVLVAVLGLGAWGFRRGFVHELIDTVGAIISAVLAYRLYPPLLSLFGVSADSPWWVGGSAIICLFVAFMVVISVVGRYVLRFIRAIHLGLYDRLAGFVLGALKGGVCMMVVSLAILWVVPDGDRLVASSKLAKANLLICDTIARALPGPIRQRYLVLVGEEVHSQTEDRGNVYLLGTPWLKLSYLRTKPLHGRIIEWNPETGAGTVEYTWQGSTRYCALMTGFPEAHVVDRQALAVGAEVEFLLGHALDQQVMLALAIQSSPSKDSSGP